MSLWRVLKDAMSELFEFDGRVARSIRMIVLQPGRLALAFYENKRASFVSPFRLFMFTTILYFFLFSISIQPPRVAADRERGPAPSETATESGKRAYERAIRTEQPRSKLDLEARIEQRQSEVADGLDVMRSLLELDRVRKLEEILDESPESFRIQPILVVAKQLQENPTMYPWLQGVLSNVVVDAVHSPTVLFDETLDNAPLMMVVLLPWYTMLLMIVYSRRGKRLVHHLVFAIHVHSFSFMLLSIGMLTPEPRGYGDTNWWEILWSTIDLLLVITLAVHTYLSFKTFYQDGYAKTLLKYFGVGLFYAMGFIPAFGFVVALTLAEYL